MNEPKRPFWDRVHDSPFLAGEPLLRSSTLLRVCWWWLVGCPLAVLLIVVFRGRKPDVGASSRRFHLWLGLVVLPMFVLCMVLDAMLGWHARAAFGWEEMTALAGLFVWLLALWQVRRRVLLSS